MSDRPELDVNTREDGSLHSLIDKIRAVLEWIKAMSDELKT